MGKLWKTVENYGKEWKSMDKWRGHLYMARVSDQHQVSDGNLWTFG
jgi:hypothetical protein